MVPVAEGSNPSTHPSPCLTRSDWFFGLVRHRAKESLHPQPYYDRELDNLTHTLTGLLLARAGLGRLAPRAALTAVLAANIPDLDVVSGAFGSHVYLDYHRHFTHALAAAPLLAALPLLALRTKRPDWPGAYLVSLAGVLSHVLMDWTNIYGTRLALPFSAAWLRLDFMPVVDIWILMVFLLALAAPAFSRLVGSEIGERRRQGAPGRGWARFALGFFLLWSAGRALAHQRAVAILDAHLYGGSPPAAVAALPDPVNPLRWRGLVRLPGRYSLAAVNLLRRFDPEAVQTYYPAEPSPARQAAAATPPFQALVRFAAFPLWIVTPLPEGEWQVDLLDLRFGAPAQPGFVASARVDSANRVLQAGFSFGRLRIR